MLSSSSAATDGDHQQVLDRLIQRRTWPGLASSHMEVSYGVASSGGLSFTSRMRMLTAEWDAMVWLSTGKDREKAPEIHLLSWNGIGGGGRNTIDKGWTVWRHFHCSKGGLELDQKKEMTEVWRSSSRFTQHGCATKGFSFYEGHFFCSSLFFAPTCEKSWTMNTQAVLGLHFVQKNEVLQNNCCIDRKIHEKKPIMCVPFTRWNKIGSSEQFTWVKIRHSVWTEDDVELNSHSWQQTQKTTT